MHELEKLKKEFLKFNETITYRLHIMNRQLHSFENNSLIYSGVCIPVVDCKNKKSFILNSSHAANSDDVNKLKIMAIDKIKKDAISDLYEICSDFYEKNEIDTNKKQIQNLRRLRNKIVHEPMKFNKIVESPDRVYEIMLALVYSQCQEKFANFDLSNKTQWDHLTEEEQKESNRLIKEMIDVVNKQLSTND